ncbi:fructan beta-fructosidase [Breznakia sp. PF5-3]|uniref:GH32 C-terminal domain-containing protein n=1 Tax=unclassified Breznakia TaxID=2623764 RepID=UPI002405B20B|nr:MULTISPECIES: GH32 C-terminal domain-containing protein [unclassified Breznakia]MDF9825625.1 fructan beta-fructosidase [Breznakia sp. PM6-1]MDF9836461.1 fructan beta-fructosidase [Breznakia sp. PF5-3]MDF9838626.1 fructan beta-fructosidase [Breznakia sp. PFB2-8]MDF9860657.1 fructan beta-fructosidase [Breznakia sp. PH5-24]
MYTKKLYKVGYVFICTLLIVSSFYSNTISLEASDIRDDIREVVEEGTFTKGSNGEILKDFTSQNGTLQKNEGEITLSKEAGDHFVAYDADKRYKSFIYEADVDVLDGPSAALLVGIKNKDNVSAETWYGANFNTNDFDNTARLFKVNDFQEYFKVNKDDATAIVDFNQTLHLSIEFKENGDFIYKLSNKGSNQVLEKSGNVAGWEGGYVGLLTFDTEAKYSNIKLLDTSLSNSQSLFKTDLSNLHAKEGAWSVQGNGLQSVSEDYKDAILLSDATAKNFVYRADVKFNERKDTAASLVFRADSDMNNKNMYVANLNAQSGEARIFKFEDGRALDLVQSQKIKLNDKNEYHLKVTAIDKHFVFYINGELVLNTADYTMGSVGGQNDALLDGQLGLMTWNGNVTYQNVEFMELDDTTTPTLSQLSIVPNGTIDQDLKFADGQYVYIGYVKNDTTSIALDATKKNSNTDLVVTNANGDVLDINNLPVTLGKNVFTITASNGNAKLVYRVMVHKRLPDANYYNEDYRGQYHYSVKEGWANDPNGMVYYNGKYHLFYQFYNDTNWGPMHWAHATSSDLIHWDEQPIEFYPDEYGTMFSGCAVIDEGNTSGLFSSNAGGLVALITTDGNGQRVIAAYSEDGETWEKAEGVAIDWTEDSLQSEAFRDPKVFRYEGKWFMVIAGGQLRIYSSDNLLDWTEESVYPNLHTECPDLYPLEVVDEQGVKTGESKWVLDRGGRQYKVGDFKQVDGNWEFVPDDAYKSNNDAKGMGHHDVDGIMNFGKDSYAAMTYYMGDFGTSTSMNHQRIIAINWMNTWEDYCNLVDDASNNTVFNGTFNLQLELSLTKNDNGDYVLRQVPIKEYEDLRDTEIKYENVEVTEGKNILADFKGDTYEVVANFKPQSGTKEVGFKARTGNNQETVVKYNFETQKITIDRSKSGAYPTAKFLEVDEQRVKVNDDGSIDLHIYVDKASIEVFTKDYTVTGANQIFPNPTSLGAEVFCVGEAATANITIYSMESIWTDKVIPTQPIAIGLSDHEKNIYVDDQFDLDAWVTPLNVSQDVEWKVEDENILSVTPATKENRMKVTALSAGTTKITVASKTNPEIKAECIVNVRVDNFQTNLSGYTANGGTWYIDDTYYHGIDSGNAFMFAENRATIDTYTYESDVLYKNGIVNVIFASQTTNVWDGCYAVQLVDNKVRLFDFKGDYTFAETFTLKKASDDIYHVEIDVEGDRIIVKVNGEQYIDHTLSNAEQSRSYRNGLFGMGIYNAHAQFANVFVTTSAPATQVIDTFDTIEMTFDKSLDDLKAVLATEASVACDAGIVKKEKETITWDLSGVNMEIPGVYEITGKTASNLEVSVQLVIKADKQSMLPPMEAYKDLDKTLYTRESVEIYTEAYFEALLIYNNPNATYSQMLSAIEQLQQAREGLEKLSTTPDKKPNDDGKPATKPTDSIEKGNGVMSGDNSNVFGYMILLISSVIILAFARKKVKE